MDKRLSEGRILLAGAWLLLGSVSVAFLTGALADVAHTRDDSTEIRRVVEEGFLARGEACLTINMTRTTELQSLLADYWSDEPPLGSALRARQTEWTRKHPTIDATFQASYYATAIAEDVITGNLESWLAIPEVTPMWLPDTSPLGIVRAQVEECHDYHASRSGHPIAFGVDAYNYRSVAIVGDEAVVEVEIAFYTDYEFPDGSVDHVAGSNVFRFDLVRQDASWRIADESRDRWGHG